MARQLTGLITLKAGAEELSAVSQQPLGFMQFMVDCTVLLNHSVVLGVSATSPNCRLTVSRLIARSCSR